MLHNRKGSVFVKKTFVSICVLGCTSLAFAWPDRTSPAGHWIAAGHAVPSLIASDYTTTDVNVSSEYSGLWKLRGLVLGSVPVKTNPRTGKRSFIFFWPFVPEKQEQDLTWDFHKITSMLSGARLVR
jgi:hypothetical protein